MKFTIVRSARIAAAATLLTAGVAVAQPVSSSAASPLAAAIHCTTTLSFPAPAGGSSTCNGTASGIAGGQAAVQQVFTSSFNYNEPCPPLTGTAAGTYASGAATGSFTWTRAGLTAVLVLHPDGGTAGAAAALFLPLGLNASSLTAPCPPSTVNAQVVAVGVGA